MPTIPIAEREFDYRTMTADDATALSELFARIEKIPTSGAATGFALTNQAAQVGMIGWRGVVDDKGVPVPFTPTMLGAILTPAQLFDLLTASVRERLAEAGIAARAKLFDARAIEPNQN